MATDLEPVYRRLKAILKPYARRLHVTDESPTTYALDVAGVDEGLFGELDALTKRGYERTASDPTWGAAKRAERGMAHRRADQGETNRP